MKTGMRHIRYMLIFTLLTSLLYAQTPDKEQVPDTRSKSANSKKPKTDFYSRVVSWWDSGNGFICKVSVDKVSYLTRYDKQGKYVETLIQKAWNDSSALQPSFQKSQYRLHKVISYWEVLDKNKKGYYLEMNDRENNDSGVWADEQGVFSTIPPTKTIKTATANK
jgi:hypothetical protein